MSTLPRLSTSALAAFGLALLLPVTSRAGDTSDSLLARARGVLSQSEGELRLPGLHSAVSVIRDRWGIAHIEAENTHDLFFAQGFVVAQDRLFQIDLWRRTGAGEMAELDGPKALEGDRFARLMLYRGDMDAEWRSYASDTREIVTAFAEGINAYIKHVGPQGLPVMIQALRKPNAAWFGNEKPAAKRDAFMLAALTVAAERLHKDQGTDPTRWAWGRLHAAAFKHPLAGISASLDYRSLVISRVVDGVKRAINNLEPARIAWGTGKLPQWVGNRRWLLKEGITNPNPFGGEDRAVMNPSSTLIPRLAGLAGPTNPEVYCLSVQATDGRQIALMANYWLHYVGGVGREDLSADYFGEFCRRIEQTLGAPCVGILANGPCGDVNSNDYSGKTPARSYKPYEKIAVVANDLAQEVLRVRQSLTYQDWVPLKAAASDVELAVRRPTPEMIQWAEGVLAKSKDAAPVHRLEQPYAQRVVEARNAKPDTAQVIIQAFRIGDLGIASIPFEVFTETGLEIKARSPFKDTFTIELANGSNGYLPTPRQHDFGGYETWLGTNRVEREASVKITARALELLQSIRTAP